MRGVITILDGVHTYFFLLLLLFFSTWLKWKGWIMLIYDGKMGKLCKSNIFTLLVYFLFHSFFLLSIEALCRFSSCVHFHINGFLHIKFIEILWKCRRFSDFHSLINSNQKHAKLVDGGFRSSWNTLYSVKYSKKMRRARIKIKYISYDFLIDTKNQLADDLWIN